MPLFISLTVAVFLSAFGFAQIPQSRVPDEYVKDVKKFVGVYQGQWLGETTDTTIDDLTAHPHGELLLEIALGRENVLHADFLKFSAESDTAVRIDFLGLGCGSRILQFDSIEQTDVLVSPGKAVEGIILRFAFDWGQCTKRVLTIPTNQFQILLYQNPFNGTHIAETSLIKTYTFGQLGANVDVVRMDDKIYFCPPAYTDVTETCIEYKDSPVKSGEPVGVVGETALYYTRESKFIRNSELVPIYIRGLFKSEEN